jgi:hypothetical protein
VVDEVERTAARAAGTVEQAGLMAAEVELVARQAATVVVEAERVTSGAAGTLAGTAELTATAGRLLAQYEPPLLALRPTVERLAAATDPDEVDAMVALVDRLPVLLDSMDRDVLPLLSQLNVMAPDLHALLEAVDDMRTTLAGIPGFGRLLRRGEEELADRP